MYKSLKMLLIIIGWIAVVTMFALAFVFYRMYNISPADLKYSEGVIANDPKFSEDEYGVKTSMRFYLEGEEMPVSVGGILLRSADKQIFDLKKGDQVRFYEKKNGARDVVDGNRRFAMGLGNQEKYFYTQEDALNFYQSADKIFYMILFMIMGGIIAFFLLK